MISHTAIADAFKVILADKQRKSVVIFHNRCKEAVRVSYYLLRDEYTVDMGPVNAGEKRHIAYYLKRNGTLPWLWVKR